MLSLFLLLILTSCQKEPEMYTLTVTSSIGGIVSTSGGTVESGTSITVSATPTSEYVFAGWSNGSLVNPLTIIVNLDQTLSANFIKKKYLLKINISGEGKVVEEILNAGKSTEYNSGTTLKLTAIPAENSEFIGWEGAINGRSNPQELLISEPKTVLAVFNKLNPIYLDENGVTIKAYDWSEIGDKGIIDGVEYTIVDEATLRLMVANDEDVTKVVTTKISNMQSLFNANRQFNQDISSWDISNVNSLYYMFQEAQAFNQNIGSWDVGKVTDMRNIFTNATSFNQDLSKWNVSNVENMHAMFANSPFNQDISDWDVSNVKDMGGMFSSNRFFNQPIGSWDTSNVTTMWAMFANSPFNQDLSKWNVSNVENMSYMFNQTPFNQDISNWDVSNVTNMNGIFYKSNFNQDLSKWNVSNVENMQQMFDQTPFNQDISNWDVSNVTNMISMFYQATLFNQDLSKWCVRNIISEPIYFSTNSALISSNKPVWGTCPNN